MVTVKIFFYITYSIAGLLSVSKANYQKYHGYKVFSVTPSSSQAQLLQSFKGNLDFWTPLNLKERPVKVMVEPQDQKNFTEFLNQHRINYRVIIHNVSESLRTESIVQNTAARSQQPNQISFDKFEELYTIRNYLLYLEEEYPKIVSLITIGNSYEGREMIVIKISKPSLINSEKPIILIDAGIHPREWISPATALYVIRELVENSSNENLIENVDWYILPVFNPDGYVYTFKKDRLWRKTRSRGKECYGVDANRNFDILWGTAGASNNECSETYKGPYPFSENETRAFRNFSRTLGDKIKLYLSFHSYGKYILYSESTFPSNSNELQDLGEIVARDIYNYSGKEWIVGNTAAILYATSGSSDTWMMAVNGVKLSYCIELQENDDTEFELPPSQILDSVKETFVGIKAFHSYIEKKYHQPMK